MRIVYEEIFTKTTVLMSIIIYMWCAATSEEERDELQITWSTILANTTNSGSITTYYFWSYNNRSSRYNNRCCYREGIQLQEEHKQR